MDIDEIPSTRILDHIVYLAPVAGLADTVKEFEEFGFTVLPGGRHADGATENALIVLHDGIYVELISFLEEATEPPHRTPQSLRRAGHWWAFSKPGWIDYALLGFGVSNPPDGPAQPEIAVETVINERGARRGPKVVYSATRNGGRVRPDGQELQWRVTAQDVHVHGIARGALPFFCADVTPRTLRVPLDPATNADHRNKVLGIKYIRMLAGNVIFRHLQRCIQSVLGLEAFRTDYMREEEVWEFERPAIPTGASTLPSPRLYLKWARKDEEKQYLADRQDGIYEVAFWADVEERRDIVTSTGARFTFFPLSSPVGAR